MSTHVRVPGAGNQNRQFAFRCAFSGADQSDIPQLQAWDDFTCATTVSESLTGTPGNSSKSMIAVKSTHTGPAGVNWATGLAQTPGGAVTNRLKGTAAFVLLGADAPVAPYPAHRNFQLAVMVPDDASPGSAGMQPVLAVKMFYAGAAPDVTFEYNTGDDVTPVWAALTSSPKGTPMAISVANGILPTGVGSVSGTMNPIVRPGSGEKAAEEYWIRTS